MNNIINMRPVSPRLVDRLKNWQKALGEPLAPDRANPDNDLIYLLIDAVEHINELERYARHLERAFLALTSETKP